MWDEIKRCRFDQLRQQPCALTEPERAELTQLTQELEAAEAAYLNPATARLQQQRESLETQNRVLEGLARRKELLVNRLRDFLAETQAERRAIEGELASVLGESSGSPTDG